MKLKSTFNEIQLFEKLKLNKKRFIGMHTYKIYNL